MSRRMIAQHHYRAAVKALHEGNWEGAAAHLFVLVSVAPGERRVRGPLVALEKANPAAYWRAAFTFALERGALDHATAALETLNRLNLAATDLPEMRDRLQALAETMAGAPSASNGAAAAEAVAVPAQAKTAEEPQGEAGLPSASQVDWLAELEKALAAADLELDTQPIEGLYLDDPLSYQGEDGDSEAAIPLEIEQKPPAELTVITEDTLISDHSLSAWLLEHLPAPPGIDDEATLPGHAPDVLPEMPPPIPEDGDHDAPRALKAATFSADPGPALGGSAGPVYNALSEPRALKTASFGLEETLPGGQVTATQPLAPDVAVAEAPVALLEAVQPLVADELEFAESYMREELAPEEQDLYGEILSDLVVDEEAEADTEALAPSAADTVPHAPIAAPAVADAPLVTPRPPHGYSRLNELLFELVAFILIGGIGLAVILVGQGRFTSVGASDAPASTRSATLAAPPAAVATATPAAPTDLPALIAEIDARLAQRETPAIALAELSALRGIALVLTEADSPLQEALLTWIDEVTDALAATVHEDALCSGDATPNCAAAQEAVREATMRAGESRRALCALTACPES